MNAVTEIKATDLIGALAIALPELEGARKNASNPHFKSKYADLGAVIDAIRPVAEHGVWFIQESHDHEAGALVETFFIGHGERISAGKVFVPASKKDAHGFGSALTYARRYGLTTAFGLSTEDDDGNAATKAPPAKSKTMPDNVRAKIVQLCEAVGDNQSGKICSAYKVSDITRLSSDQAKAVITKLEEKLAEKAKSDTDARAKADA